MYIILHEFSIKIMYQLDVACVAFTLFFFSYVIILVVLALKSLLYIYSCVFACLFVCIVCEKRNISSRYQSRNVSSLLPLLLLFPLVLFPRYKKKKSFPRAKKYSGTKRKIYLIYNVSSSRGSNLFNDWYFMGFILCLYFFKGNKAKRQFNVTLNFCASSKKSPSLSSFFLQSVGCLISKRGTIRRIEQWGILIDYMSRDTLN